ncbi:MAG: diguanylate cyclase [Bacillota bacterium]
MNYETLDYMSNGVIIEQAERLEVIYINRVARQILHITDDISVTSVKQLIASEDTYAELKQRIKSDLETYGKSEGIVYLHTFSDTIYEVDFCCTWLDEKEKLICYSFQNAAEVFGESQVTFRELAEALPSGIIVMDIENELSITYANLEHYKILGIDTDAESTTYLLRDFIFEEDVNWVLTEIFENLANDKEVDIEFRMNVADGDVHAKWVRLFGRAKETASGEKLFYSSLKDLSQRRSINDKLHMERIIFYKITEITEETLFRLDMQTNIMHFIGKKIDIFGDTNVFENYPESITKLDKVYPEDICVREEMLENFRNGIETPTEIRYKTQDNNYEWYKLTYSFIRNGSNKPVLVIGKMVNIHKQKILEEQAKTDALTGFYNKVTTEHEVNRLIHFKKENPHTFFIIDIDNFKSINDNLGHHFGDMLLVGISNDIKECFRETDVFGRIGGDEFVVVMQNMNDPEIIEQKARMLCGILNKTFSSDGQQYIVSASIGIATYPEHGLSYEDLYKKSDMAMYEVKEAGKNGFRQFYSALSHGKAIRSPKKADDYKMQPDLMNTQVVSTVLNLLYETNDFNISIASILEYIGTVYKLDKCYIFESMDDGKTFRDYHRWYSKEEYKNAVTRCIQGKHIEDFVKDTDDHGVFYTNDITEVKEQWVYNQLAEANVKSVFLLDSLKKYDERGVFFLEDCKTKKVWSQEEVVTLLHIGRLMFTALNYRGMIQKSTRQKNKD